MSRDNMKNAQKIIKNWLRRIEIYKVENIASPIWTGDVPLNWKIEFEKKNSKLNV